MEWLILEEVDDDGTRLVAMRPRDGARRALYTSQHDSPLYPSVHPQAIRIAVDAVSRSKLHGQYRSRVGLVNVGNRGVGWLRQSLDPNWRIRRAVFDASGSRLAMEGAYAGAPVTDIYVLDLKFSGNSVREKIIAGADNKQGLGCVTPAFLPDGDRLVYLQNTRAEGAWEVCLLDLTRPGDSAAELDGRAPSVLSVMLTDGAGAVPEPGLHACTALDRVFFVGQARGGTRQRVRWVGLSGGDHHDLGRAHQRIDELSVAPAGELVAYSADGSLWLTDVESGATVSLVEPEPNANHRGVLFDLEEGRLWFCTNDPSGAKLRIVDLSALDVTTVLELGDVTVLGVHGFPDTEEASKRLDQAPVDLEVIKGHATEGATQVQRVKPFAAVAALVGERKSSTPTPIIRRVMMNAPDATVDGDPDAEAAEAAQQPAAVAVDQAPPDDDDHEAPDNTMDEPPELEASVSDLVEDDDEAPAAIMATTETPVPDVGPTTEHAMAVVDDREDGSVDEATQQVVLEPQFLDDSGIMTSVPDAGQPKPTLETPAPTSGPQVDFSAWMSRVPVAPDPTVELASLSAFQDDTNVLRAATEHLNAQRTAAATDADAATALVFAIGAVAALKSDSARPSLVEMCTAAHARVQAGDLPEAEQHFALGALRYLCGLDDHFDAGEAYTEYESTLTRIGEVLEKSGEDAAMALMGSTLAHYDVELAEALAAARSPQEQAAFEAEQDAAVAREEAHAQEREAATARLAAEAKARAQAEAKAHAAKAAAAEVEAVAAAAKARAEADAAEEARVRAEMEAAAAVELERRESAEFARKKREANDAAIAAQVQEQSEWIRQRAAAEAAAKAEAAEAAARAKAEAKADAKAEAEEEALYAEKRAAAEKAAADERAAAERTAEEEHEVWAKQRAAAEKAAAEQTVAEEAKWAKQKAAAEAAAAASQAAEQDAWAKQRAEAERAATEHAEWTQQRAVAEAMAAQSAAVERASALAATKIAEAEAAVAAAQAAQRALDSGTPMPISSPTPAPIPAARPAPVPIPARTPPPAFENPRPAFRPALTDIIAPTPPPADPGGWDALPETPMGPILAAKPPVLLPLAGLAAALGGVACAASGAKLGSTFVALGVLWIAAGIGLLGDRRWGWLLGIGAFALNGAHLIYFGMGPLPEWVPAIVPIAGGLASLGFAAALFAPSIRKRFGPNRRRF